LSFPQKKVWLISTCRADLSTIMPLTLELAKFAGLDINLGICGKHSLETLSEINALKKLGINVHIGPVLPPDRNELSGEDLAAFLIWVSDILDDRSIGVVVGDRFEILILSTWIVSRNNTLIHLSGGDLTPMSKDNKYRYAISELADLHLVNHFDHRNNLIKKGYLETSVHVIGDPALQYLSKLEISENDLLELKKELNIATQSFAMLCYHPTNNNSDLLLLELNACFEILDNYNETVIVTLPNQDKGSDMITNFLHEKASSNSKLKVLTLKNQKDYYVLLKFCDFLIGNSSSGIWEAPSFGTPFINIGERQNGRARAENVIDVGCDVIIGNKAIRAILNGKFKYLKSNPINPYYQENSALLAAKIINDIA
jgi:UDP-hydrolysing UDP-N-acetyl-D-glucosamine 2-epimerase